jgi:ABC-type phosphate transport system substrate-binding protein
VRHVPLLCLFYLWVSLPPPLWAEEHLAVIVADSQRSESVSNADLARIYERRQRFWHNGARIVPINLPAEHPARRQFSLQIFNKPPEDMQEYWNQQYFHGVAPPYVLASDEAVREFVANTPGAIGYINAAAVNGQVKVLLLLPLSPAQ